MINGFMPVNLGLGGGNGGDDGRDEERVNFIKSVGKKNMKMDQEAAEEFRGVTNQDVNDGENEDSNYSDDNEGDGFNNQPENPDHHQDF